MAKKQKDRIMITEVVEDSGVITLKLGTGYLNKKYKNGVKDFKTRFTFYFYSKDAVEDFIKDLRKKANKAFRK